MLTACRGVAAPALASGFVSVGAGAETGSMGRSRAATGSGSGMSALKTVEPDAGRAGGAAGAAVPALEGGGEAENGKTAGTLGAAAATKGAGAAGGGVAGGIAAGRFVVDEIAAEAPGD